MSRLSDRVRRSIAVDSSQLPSNDSTTVRRGEDPFALPGGPAGVRDAPGEQGGERERDERGEEGEAFHCGQGRVNPCLRRFRGL